MTSPDRISHALYQEAENTEAAGARVDPVVVEDFLRSAALRGEFRVLLVRMTGLLLYLTWLVAACREGLLGGSAKRRGGGSAPTSRTRSPSRS
ncbi:MAG: hypothetical protein HY903_16815 [Deltaproteobacteria bacterium]|nr:hypothetical protein [Deltaproteobacteria bacterium]